MTRALSAVLAALCAAGCPKAAAPVEPAKPTPPPVVDAPPAPLALDLDLQRLAARSTQFYQEVASAFATAGPDCATATTQLLALQKTYADAIAASAKVLHEGRGRALRIELDVHAGAMDAAMKSIVESATMRQCAEDAAFKTTYDDMGGARP